MARGLEAKRQKAHQARALSAQAAAQAADVSGLAWRPIGPVPDPACVLEAWLTLSGVAFRLLAVRVKRPVLVGWSADPSHEATPGHSQGEMLFDRAAYLEWLRLWDAAPGDPESAQAWAALPDAPAVPDTPEAKAWAAAYRAVHHGDLTDPAHMLVRDGAPHFLLGVPTRAAPRGPAVTLAPVWRADPWAHYLTPFYRDVPLRIEGVPCALDGVLVEPSDRGWIPAARAAGFADHDGWLRWFARVLVPNPIGAAEQAMPFDGGHLLGWIAPDPER